jgi:predicted nucleic acid-binding protein
VRAELTIAADLGIGMYVSAVTLTEVLRGHRRDAGIHRLLTGVEAESVTPLLGRAAGELLGQTRSSQAIDAIVAVTAQRLGVRVRLVTSDPVDLETLTAEMDDVTVVAI